MDFIRTYFNAERAESIVFFAIGILAMTLACWFFFGKNEALLRGAAYPLAVVALLQIGVGVNIFQRSPKDAARVEGLLQNEPARIQSEEIPRMEKVMQQFVVLRYTEIALFVTGLLLVFMSKNDLWRGVGFGLAVQSLLMLGADYFAEARGHVYLAALKNWVLK